MKRLLSLLLAVLLIASMSTTAFAANNDGTGSTDIPVNGTYDPGATAEDVVSVEITWDEMSFTYAEPSLGEWDPESHTYINGTLARWIKPDLLPQISIKNHSNVDIDFEVVMDWDNYFLTEEGYYTEKKPTVFFRRVGASGHWYDDITSQTLISAEGLGTNETPTFAVSVYVANGIIEQNQRIGSLQITISKNTDNTGT